MNKLDIENKLKDLSKRQEQAMANLNAISGAVQLCKELLQEEEQRELEREDSTNVIEDNTD